MWFFVTSTGKRIYLKSNVSVSIGRKKTDILLSHDASISKLHASVVVKPLSNVTAEKFTSLCILKDQGSKYGTYIAKNGKFEKIITDVHLKDQDIIRIGLQKEIFTAKYIPIISVTSSLQDNEKDKLLEIMNVIDGVITTDWNKYCTHLTVVKPKLTQKVAVSLAANIPIVSIDYWDAVKSIIESGDPLPETDKFIPRINEQYISKISASLAPNDKRKTLFTDLTFNFFSTKQHKLYKTMIQIAGGKSVLFNANNGKTSTLKDNFIFVHYSVNDTTQFIEDCVQEYDNICKKLDACKRRVIPEFEIPLAILHCSIEQYCNPKFNFGNCLKRREKPNYNLPETLVVDTQDQNVLIIEDLAVKQKSCSNKGTNYVAETVLSDDDTSVLDDVMPKESLDSSEELTPQRECTASKKLFIPETIESSYSSQRNTDSQIKHNSSYSPLKANIDNNLKETCTSIIATFGEKYIPTLSYDYDNEQVGTSYTKELPSSKVQFCIPETIDNNDFNSSENSKVISNKINNSSKVINHFSKEVDLDDVTIMKKIKESNKDLLKATNDNSKTKITKNNESHVQKEIEKDKTLTSTFPSNTKLLNENDSKGNCSTVYRLFRKDPPGKTFKKVYVKIPEKRQKLMDITEEN